MAAPSPRQTSPPLSAGLSVTVDSRAPESASPSALGFASASSQRDQELSGQPPSEAREGADVETADDEDDEDDDEDDDWMDEEEEEEEGKGEDEDEDTARPKTKSDRLAAEGKKAGNPGRFRGAEKELLLTFEASYTTIVEMRVGKTKELALFWSGLREAYWKAFGWEDARAGMGPKARRYSQKKVVRSTNRALKSWFRWRHRNVGGWVAKAWRPAIEALRASQTSAPKRACAWQTYHSHRKDDIKAEAEKRTKSGEAKHKGPALKNAIAREWYAELSSEEKAEWEEKADTIIAARRKAWEDAKSIEVVTDPELMKEARKRMASVVTPLLKLIGNATGFKCLTLLAGQAPDEPGDKVAVAAVHYGQTKEAHPRDFATYDASSYKLVMQHFAKFVDQGKHRTEGSATSPTNVEVIATEPPKAAPKKVSAKQKNAQGKTSSDVPGQPATSNPSTQTTGNARRDPTDDVEHGEAGGSCQKTVPKPRPVVKLTAAAGAALVIRIQRLEGAAREKRIKEVNALNKFELDRENNIATAKELALRLKEGASLEDLGIAAPMMPFNIPGARPTQTVTTTTHDRLSPVPTSPTSPAANEVNDNAEDGVSRASTPSASVQGSSEIPPVTVELNSDGWPAWLEDHHKRFSAVSVSPSLEVVWQELLGFWSMLEREMGFASPLSGFPTRNRPVEIFNWQKNARKGHVIVLNKDTFSKSWVAWWKVINPPWREADGNHLKLTDKGSWSTMFIPGKNGFLNIIGGLVALRDCVDETEWEKAVRDVRWTVERTLAAKIGRGTKRKPTEDGVDNGAASKRPRTRQK